MLLLISPHTYAPSPDTVLRQVLKRSGSPTEQRHAARIQPVRSLRLLHGGQAAARLKSG